MTKEQARELAGAIFVHVSEMLRAGYSPKKLSACRDRLVDSLCDILADDPKPECPAKRMEYYVCYSEGEPEDLAVKVNKRLVDGWRPQGGVSVGLRLIYQALVREVAG